jgi:23S rRNA (adenine2030-N6)-methyltransferase
MPRDRNLMCTFGSTRPAGKASCALAHVAEHSAGRYGQRMLSYQHSYHAGNLADVQKHSLLAWTLDYLTAKDKPLTYIETHAGRGVYDLKADEAAKTGEAAMGIALAESWFPAVHPYHQRLSEARAAYGQDAYPGSPLIAALGLRETDTMHLAELHPTEVAHLRTAAAEWGAHVYQRDGFDLALALTPPTPRRGLMLVDPSYEVKSDYDAIPKHAEMLKSLTSAFPDALRHEVRFPPARDGHRMEGSGMFVVNPPYGLDEECARLTDRFRNA